MTKKKPIVACLENYRKCQYQCNLKGFKTLLCNIQVKEKSGLQKRASTEKHPIEIARKYIQGSLKFGQFWPFPIYEGCPKIPWTGSKSVQCILISFLHSVNCIIFYQNPTFQVCIMLAFWKKLIFLKTKILNFGA